MYFMAVYDEIGTTNIRVLWCAKCKQGRYTWKRVDIHLKVGIQCVLLLVENEIDLFVQTASFDFELIFPTILKYWHDISYPIILP